MGDGAEPGAAGAHGGVGGAGRTGRSPAGLRGVAGAADAPDWRVMSDRPNGTGKPERLRYFDQEVYSPEDVDFLFASLESGLCIGIFLKRPEFTPCP